MLKPYITKIATEKRIRELKERIGPWNPAAVDPEVVASIKAKDESAGIGVHPLTFEDYATLDPRLGMIADELDALASPYPYGSYDELWEAVYLPVLRTMVGAFLGFSEEKMEWVRKNGAEKFLWTLHAEMVVLDALRPR